MTDATIRINPFDIAQSTYEMLKVWKNVPINFFLRSTCIKNLEHHRKVLPITSHLNGQMLGFHMEN